MIRKLEESSLIWSSHSQKKIEIFKVQPKCNRGYKILTANPWLKTVDLTLKHRLKKIVGKFACFSVNTHRHGELRKLRCVYNQCKNFNSFVRFCLHTHIQNFSNLWFCLNCTFFFVNQPNSRGFAKFFIE